MSTTSSTASSDYSGDLNTTSAGDLIEGYQADGDKPRASSFGSSDLDDGDIVDLDDDGSGDSGDDEGDSAVLLTREVKSKKPASVLSSVSNLSNTILGAGMLGLPFALASMAIFGLHLLAVASTSVPGLTFPAGAASYKALSLQAFPQKFAAVIDAAVAVKCFGVATSYLIVVGDVMPNVVHFFDELSQGSNLSNSILADRRIWIAIAMLGAGPLATLKRMNSLRYTSYVAIATVCYVVCMVFYFFITSNHTPEIVWFKLDSTFFKALPIFVFSFTCHQNLFSIYNELRGSLYKVNLSSTIAVTIGFWIYGLIGIFGFLTFGVKLGSNIVNEYDPNSVIVTIGRIGLAILVTFSYPLQIHPCRRCVLSLLSYFSKLDQSPKAYWITTGVLVSTTFGLSMAVKDLGLVFALVGATGSTTITFILPGLFYIRVQKNAPWRAKKIMAAVLSVSGILLMVVSLTVIIISTIAGEKTGH